ncbi:hypothetical protein BJF78_00805 [Pseudonocardia sp. CNS-139]|nr:hypothetical protein BJF78_00805 [Pseudonocardia sp. CNS-139]
MLSAQPALHWRVGSIMRERFGAAGTRRFAPLRDWIDHGVPVAGGSDGPDFPIPPLFGMWQARTRTVNGLAEPMGTEHALTPAEALALYTTNAAAYCYAEAVRGSLAVGKLADWVELSADPVATPDDELRDVAVERTVVGGAVVHERM